MTSQLTLNHELRQQGLDGVREALDVLGCWRVREWSGVVRLAGRVGPMVREAFVGSVVAESVPGYTRAALGWCVADARALGRAWPHGERAEEYGPGIAALVMDVAYFAALCDPAGASRWPEADPGRTGDAEAAVGLLDRWAGLPAAWRAAVLREARYGVRVRGRLSVAEVVGVAVAYAGKGAPPPMPGYAELRTVDAPELARRILRLPRDWRVEAFRRIAAGADPLAVEADARKAIRTTVT